MQEFRNGDSQNVISNKIYANYSEIQYLTVLIPGVTLLVDNLISKLARKKTYNWLQDRDPCPTLVLSQDYLGDYQEPRASYSHHIRVNQNLKNYCAQLCLSACIITTGSSMSLSNGERRKLNEEYRFVSIFQEIQQKKSVMSPCSPINFIVLVLIF